MQEIRAHFCYDLKCVELGPESPPPASGAAAANASAPSTSGPAGTSGSAATGSASATGATAAGGVHEKPAETPADAAKKKFAHYNTLYNSIWLVFGCVAAFSSGFFASRLGRCALLSSCLVACDCEPRGCGPRVSVLSALLF